MLSEFACQWFLEFMVDIFPLSDAKLRTVHRNVKAFLQIFCSAIGLWGKHAYSEY